MIPPLANYREPEVTLIRDPDAYTKLELCGRNCYKSEEKTGPGTAEKLLSNIIARGHESVLEHYRISVTLPSNVAWILLQCNRYLRLHVDGVSAQTYAYVQLRGNIRAFRDALKFATVVLTAIGPEGWVMSRDRHGHHDGPYVYPELRKTMWKYPASKYATAVHAIKMTLGGGDLPRPTFIEFRHLIRALSTKWPILFTDIHTVFDSVAPAFTDDPTTEKVLEWMDIKEDPDYLTFRVVTDRGVTHELVRHREDMSYSQESTRYCTYGGNSGMNFVLPTPEKFEQINPTTQVRAMDLWKDHMENSSSVYQSLIECGLSPQYARSVLPNSLKTDIIVTAPIDTLCAFYRLRSGSGAHPQIREVASRLAQLCLEQRNLNLEDYVDVNDVFAEVMKQVNHIEHLAAKEKSEASSYEKPHGDARQSLEAIIDPTSSGVTH